MSCVGCGHSPCRCNQRFTQLRGAAVNRTLIAQLIPCVDSVRDLYTKFGARPYTVTLVWTRWSDGARGEGIEEVVREEPLLPTPLVELGGVNREVEPVGLAEVGGVDVSEISARFTEDYLLGRCEDGSDIAPDESFYWEIALVRPDGLATRRRFYPTGVPELHPTKFQWTVKLTKTAEDRTRSGDTRG